MKKYFKKFITIFAVCIIFVFSAVSVFAESGTYNTTYDMTGGVYTKRTWDATSIPTFKVSNSQCTVDYADLDPTIYVQLERKGLLGYTVVSDGELSGKYGGKCTLKGDKAGTYRIYFRQLSGYRITGKLSIDYSW